MKLYTTNLLHTNDHLGRSIWNFGCLFIMPTIMILTWKNWDFIYNFIQRRLKFIKIGSRHKYAIKTIG